jgi:hypothetical protein
MEDIQILTQLLNGSHLESQELERAFKLMYLMDLELKRRIKLK